MEEQWRRTVTAPEDDSGRTCVGDARGGSVHHGRGGRGHDEGTGSRDRGRGGAETATVRDREP